MEKDTYLTINAPSEGLYKSKGSKFLAYAYNVQDEEGIKEILKTLRKKYYDATHHCYAYILGAKQERYRANDDGEPNHSAGTPILNQIKSYDLTNTLVIVVRYYGGTKLGVSGLIEAYKSSADIALGQSKIIEKVVRSPVKIRYTYPETGEVMRIIEKHGFEIHDQQFDMDCQLTLNVRQSRFVQAKELLKKWLLDTTDVS